MQCVILYMQQPVLALLALGTLYAGGMWRDLLDVWLFKTLLVWSNKQQFAILDLHHEYWMVDYSSVMAG
jgi:hypothetical protein